MGRGQQKIAAVASAAGSHRTWEDKTLQVAFMKALGGDLGSSLIISYETSEDEGSNPYTSIIDPRITESPSSDLLAWGLFSSSFCRDKSLAVVELDEEGKRDLWALERIIARQQLNKDDFIIETEQDYYGDALSITLAPAPRRAISRAWRDYQAQPNDIRSRVHWLLNYEYGKILPILEEASFSIESVPTEELHFAATKHAKNLDEEALSRYSTRQTGETGRLLSAQVPQGVVFCRDPGRYRLIDGYHRLTSVVSAGAKSVLVVVARP
jgi:hypothetical protein